MWSYKLSYEVKVKVAETTMKFFWYSTDAEKPATDTAAITYNTTERTLENKVIVINKYNGTEKFSAY